MTTPHVTETPALVCIELCGRGDVGRGSSKQNVKGSIAITSVLYGSFITIADHIWLISKHVGLFWLTYIYISEVLLMNKNLCTL